MTALPYIAPFLLLAILGVSVTLFLVFALDSLARGHDISTGRRAARALIGIVKRYRPDAQNFYDLGCARGALALAVKKALPHLEICAVDNVAVRIFFAKLKSIILWRRVDFIKRDIFKTDLSRADVVYAYLWYDLMPALEQKLRNELKPGAVVITNTTNFPTWRPIYKAVTRPDISKPPDFETLFVYVKR